MIDPELSALRAAHDRLVAEYADLVAAVIPVVTPPPWPTNARAREAWERVRAMIGLSSIPEPQSYTDTHKARSSR